MHRHALPSTARTFPLRIDAVYFFSITRSPTCHPRRSDTQVQYLPQQVSIPSCPPLRRRTSGVCTAVGNEPSTPAKPSKSLGARLCPSVLLIRLIARSFLWGVGLTSATSCSSRDLPAPLLRICLQKFLSSSSHPSRLLSTLTAFGSVAPVASSPQRVHVAISRRLPALGAVSYAASACHRRPDVPIISPDWIVGAWGSPVASRLHLPMMGVDQGARRVTTVRRSTVGLCLLVESDKNTCTYLGGSLFLFGAWGYLGWCFFGLALGLGGLVVFRDTRWVPLGVALDSVTLSPRPWGVLGIESD